MKNVGNSAGNGLHITKDKKPLASTPLRKHNFNFGLKMLQRDYLRETVKGGGREVFLHKFLHKIKRKNDHCLGSLLCESTLHIFYRPHFFFKAAKATLCLPCFLCKVVPTRISLKEEEEE